MPSTHPNAKKVLIVVMPFATPEFPSLGATLVRSILASEGIETDIVYGNLLFSKLVEADPFVENSLSELPICELAFTPYYFDTPVDTAAANLRKYVLELASVQGAHTPERYRTIVQRAGACVDAMFASIDWESYDIVGFSLLMGQTVASLALARRIKAAYPEIAILIGGAHTQAPMGDEMLRSFPVIDYVIQGEADGIVAPFVRELRAGVRADFSTGGVLFRGPGGEVRSSGEARPFEALDSLPIPDFSEYFRQMEAIGLSHVQPYLPLETSRGCWWGERRHCTFCGIDDKIMTYRSKSAPRVLEEILTLSQRHRYTEFFTVDSIINFKFFNELMPTLGELRRSRGLDLTFFFESKSNISRDQVRRFRFGGVNHVQPGLESFSDHVLQLMDKGTTGIRQLQCLKLLAESNILADWNLIYCNPGETEDDYEQMSELIPSLHHLPPLHAGGLIPMQINRYAPYHNTPQRYGISNIRPKRYYPLIYPDPAIDLDRIAFYFDCDFDVPVSDGLKSGYARLKQAIDDWRECYVSDALVQTRGPGFVRVVDRRSWTPGRPVGPGEERIHLLEGLPAQVLTFCNEPCSIVALQTAFSEVASERDVEEVVTTLARDRLIYRSRTGEVVSLPLLQEAEERFRFDPERGDTRGNREERLKEALAAGSAPAGEAPTQLTTAELPVIRLGGLGRAEVGARLTQTAAAGRKLRFRIADPIRPDDDDLIDTLTACRSDGRIGYTFEAVLDGVPSLAFAERAREAGITHAIVGGGPGPGRGDIGHELWKLAAVKCLDSAGIVTTWSIDPALEEADEDTLRALAALGRSARHLPPPSSPSGPRLQDVVEGWARSHAPRTLTYARGPGFTRVFDRRGEAGRWRFVSLGEAQSEVLHGCVHPVSLPGLLAALPDLSPTAVRATLDRLIDAEIVGTDGCGHFLALPIRRSIEERWASGDH